ncbi:MAG: anthranilate synthase component I family protein [Rickettsiales bacterium]|nr:anthranilate synthase component I family protein [Rickettsiales bacterium]
MVSLDNIISENLNKNANFAIIHTGKKVPYSEENSFILSNEISQISDNDFRKIESFLSQKNQVKNLFGWFGYELKNRLETLIEEEKSFLETDELFFSNFQQKNIFSKEEFDEYFRSISAEFLTPKIKNFQSNMSKNSYLDKIKEIKKLIEEGVIYQANLTRKFFGEFAEKINPLSIFARLISNSPAPFSAFYKAGETYVLSASPELFLSFNSKNNKIITCPIKGSASASQGRELSESKKDISENLMITDLMRNDLSRVCKFGSVKVEDLFAISEFSTISHMYSTISGILEDNKNAIDVIKATFPPGSMTGAPKISAMEVCSKLENIKRGIYSGILGYFNQNDETKNIDCQFSVVIRTIIIQGNKFEFQVGGGIVYDSDPESEWQETITKASAITKTLGLTEDILRI